MRNSTGVFLRAAFAIAFLSILASALPVFGQTVKVDSTYSGYTTGVINDGVINASGGAQTTWASADTATDHWVEIDFPAAKQVSSATINWAYNAHLAAYMAAQTAYVQYWNGSAFVTVATVTNSKSVASSQVTFSPVSTTRLRYYMPAGKSYASYPNVMWLTEVSYGVYTAPVASQVTVKIASPLTGTTMNSPVTVSASATSTSSTINAMKVYVDNVDVYDGTSASVSASLPMTAGSHHISVSAWDNSGSVGTSDVYTTVSATTSGSTSGSTQYNTLFNPPTTKQLYVSTSGSDSNPGTSATYPFRTIQKAASVATAGTGVYVAPGVYNERVTINNSGTATAHIVFKSTSKWGASVQGSSGGAMFTVNGSYVDVIGFDMNGNLSTSYGSRGVAIYGSHNRIIGNHVHGMVTTATSTSSSATGGITVFWNGQTAPKRVYNEVRNNVVHDIYSTTRTAKLGACIYIADAYGFIADNLVYTCGSYGIEVNHMTTNETIINNTAANMKNGAAIMMSVGGDSTYNIVSDYNVVQNNVIVDSIVGLGAWEGGPSSHFGTHNVWKNNLTYGNTTNVSYGNVSSFSSKVVESGSTHVNPLFVNKVYSTSNTGNFRVQSGSPAINTGATATDPTIDLDGGTRPSGSFDRGAYQYGCTPVVY